MKTLAAIIALFTVVSSFAADRVGVYTRTNPATETRRVTDVHFKYGTVGDLQLMTVTWEMSVVGDFTFTANTTEEWTKDKINALPLVVAGQTNNFRATMLARWASADVIPENWTVAWAKPLWAIPVILP